jgi:hypothetical protein
MGARKAVRLCALAAYVAACCLAPVGTWLGGGGPLPELTTVSPSFLEPPPSALLGGAWAGVGAWMPRAMRAADSSAHTPSSTWRHRISSSPFSSSPSSSFFAGAAHLVPTHLEHEEALAFNGSSMDWPDLSPSVGSLSDANMLGPRRDPGGALLVASSSTVHLLRRKGSSTSSTR